MLRGGTDGRRQAPFRVPPHLTRINMAHKTDRERIIDLEQGLEGLTKTVDGILAKVPEYDKFIEFRKGYNERLKKARASLKKIKELQTK